VYLKIIEKDERYPQLMTVIDTPECQVAPIIVQYPSNKVCIYFATFLAVTPQAVVARGVELDGLEPRCYGAM
jgi:hypothetical protein